MPPKEKLKQEEKSKVITDKPDAVMSKVSGAKTSKVSLVISLIALLVSLILGGIQLYDFLNRKPDLTIKVEGINLGSFQAHPSDLTRTAMIMIAGSILNNGSRPYFPSEWVCEVVMPNGNNIICEPMMLSDSFLRSSNPPIVISEIQLHDIRRISTIPPYTRSDGIFMFSTNKIR